MSDTSEESKLSLAELANRNRELQVSGEEGENIFEPGAGIEFIRQVEEEERVRLLDALNKTNTSEKVVERFNGGVSAEVVEEVSVVGQSSEGVDEVVSVVGQSSEGVVEEVIVMDSRPSQLMNDTEQSNVGIDDNMTFGKDNKLRTFIDDRMMNFFMIIRDQMSEDNKQIVSMISEKMGSLQVQISEDNRQIREEIASLKEEVGGLKKDVKKQGEQIGEIGTQVLELKIEMGRVEQRFNDKLRQEIDGVDKKMEEYKKGTEVKIQEVSKKIQKHVDNEIQVKLGEVKGEIKETATKTELMDRKIVELNGEVKVNIKKVEVVEEKIVCMSNDIQLTKGTVEVVERESREMRAEMKSNNIRNEKGTVDNKIKIETKVENAVEKMESRVEKVDEQGLPACEQAMSQVADAINGGVKNVERGEKDLTLIHSVTSSSATAKPKKRRKLKFKRTKGLRPKLKRDRPTNKMKGKYRIGVKYALKHRLKLTHLRTRSRKLRTKKQKSEHKIKQAHRKQKQKRRPTYKHSAQTEQTSTEKAPHYCTALRYVRVRRLKQGRHIFTGCHRKRKKK